RRRDVPWFPRRRRPSPPSTTARDPPAATERKAHKAVCAITGRERPRRDLVSLETLRPSLADRIRVDHPELGPEALISRAEVARYRALYVEELLQAEHGEFTQLDRQAAGSTARHDTHA